MDYCRTLAVLIKGTCWKNLTKIYPNCNISSFFLRSYSRINCGIVARVNVCLDGFNSLRNTTTQEMMLLYSLIMLVIIQKNILK